jgi:hypothetical protein
MPHSVFKNTGEAFSDSLALPLERHSLLDLFCGQVWPILRQSFM